MGTLGIGEQEKVGRHGGRECSCQFAPHLKVETHSESESESERDKELKHTIS